MIGQTLGHYRILEKIGEGGMGVVYRARDEHLGRDVALKVLPAGALADDSARRRFRAEAEALARLNHPHIATVHDFATQDGTDFLVMEFVPGSSLADRLSAGSLPEKEVLRLAMQVAAALQEAHENRIVHRDLKPANIRLTAKGDAKVLDFGLAKLLRPVDDINTQGLTQSQAVVGTLPYMAPEQLRAEPVDARTDLYAFGCVLYEMTTGRRPFRETVSATLTDAILNRPASSPRQLAPQLSGELERIVLKCLEKDPENRYQSAREISVDFRRLATPTVVTHAPSAHPPRRARWHPPPGAGKRLAVGLGGMAVVLGILLGFNVGGLRDRLFGTAAPQIDSIAVLPLDNLSRDPEQDYFVEGMHEALTAELSKISALKVISRTSAMHYKNTDKPMPKIARELDVDALIEGSVAREGDQVRITVQLIHGPSDRHLWANSYQRQMRGVLALQGEVAQAIAEEIRVKLTPQEATQLARTRSVNPEAYQDYLRGRFFLSKVTAEGFQKSMDYFQQAIAKDPTYAQAYAAMADAYIVAGNWGYLPPREAYEKAREAATFALRADDTSGEADAALAFVQFVVDWRWAEADALFQKGVHLSPNDPNAHLWYALYLRDMRRFGEAIDQARKAQELDPLSPFANMTVGSTLFFARRYNDALAQLLRTLELDRDFRPTHQYLGEVYLQLGMPEKAVLEFKQVGNQAGLAIALAAEGNQAEALRILRQLEREVDPVSKYSRRLAVVYLSLGMREQAIQSLERDYQEQEIWLSDINSSPGLDALRSDPRFQALLRRMNFPEK